jgi:hypothetical protein
VPGPPAAQPAGALLALDDENQRFIAERTKDIDPRHVEAWMRLEHPTLDGLSRQEFTEAVYAALAASFGL